MDKIILASGSPRRKVLLEQIKLSFDIVTSNIEETIDPSLSPSELVMELSTQKAMSVANDLEQGYIVIGADTVVAYNGRILGKPQDKQEAYAMLSMLQGNIHEVYTGITLVRTRDQLIKTGLERTKVHMRKLSPALINGYINTKEPMDKAGSYGIQGIGTLLIDEISGDYNNVVGLPLKLLSDLLNEVGMNVFKSYTFIN